MNLRNVLPVVGGLTFATLGLPSQAADISLFEWGLNQNGTISGTGDPLPAGSVFDTSSGLGSIRLVFSGAGSHSGVLFVDHEIDEAINTFFNEVGEASGSAPAGLSWEIDEPGFAFGDIFDNFLADTLDNSVGTSTPDDVSMAMGWNFNLAAGQTGLVQFFVSETQPSGFYLRQYDDDSDVSIYLSSTLTIRGVPGGGGGVIPEGQVGFAASMVGLLAVGTVWRARRRPQTS